MNLALNFTINDFNGPLDLLLHLVKESKMDIYEVPLENIIKEYIDFIHKMKNLNIDIASEYLVMASELIHLKSKMLINIEDENSDEDELSINSEEELRMRLAEYEKYKMVLDDFKVLEEKRMEILTKSPESLIEYSEDVKLNTNTTIDDLVNALNSFLKRQKYLNPLSTKITKKELSVHKRTDEIRSILKNKKQVDFFDLFEFIDKPFVVITFLSILEMTKNKEITILQNKNFENITIEAK